MSLAVVLVSVAQPHAVLAAGSVQQIKTEKDAKPETGATFKPAPYDDKLVQLAEILGSLDFIRNLCERGTEPQWKTMMGQLLDSDAKEEPARREKLTAAYNRGYRTFSAIQTTCSTQLRATAERYRIEGATLATEIATRYGN
ncbi:TIGR02301 family protein [Rhizobium sp. C1]|uniref:TIGR02301 family protein n=1 Tax=Rhizobium sp. C1 TaxID=1349799 RepID=UPI001E5B3B0E|nr:TIGR02301 family protein [Rhizobium sp. C1]MCD2177576.1 TIGR02301 family protein [Rhizobium sp. C1]